jgi:hypothetical protein
MTISGPSGPITPYSFLKLIIFFFLNFFNFAIPPFLFGEGFFLKWKERRPNPGSTPYTILWGFSKLLEIFKTILKFLEYSLSILGKP